VFFAVYCLKIYSIFRHKIKHRVFHPDRRGTMRSAKELYSANERPSYEEIAELARRGRELRNEATYNLFAALFRKIAHVLHIDFKGKYSGHGTLAS